MKDKFLMRIAIAAVGALALALTAIGVIGWNQPADTKTAATTPSQPGGRIMITMQSQQQPQEPAPVQVAFTQPTANAVQVSDLQDLAHDVHLVDIEQSAQNKDQWKAALPKAQALLSQSCDCEERNWLNNFVTAGNYALSGNGKYADSAKLLITLPKNDDEATTHKISPLPE